MTATDDDDVRIRETSLWSDSCAPHNARVFIRNVLTEWGLQWLAPDACHGATELIVWLLDNGAHGVLRLQLVWDGPQVLTDVFDESASRLLPLRSVWLGLNREATGRLGAAAVALLEGVCRQWDSEETWEGRRLWASYDTRRGGR
jgi:hypothetical protein